MTDGCQRARVQAYVVAAMAASGDWSRVDRLADEAENLIRGIAGPQEQATELARLAKAVIIRTPGPPPSQQRGDWLGRGACCRTASSSGTGRMPRQCWPRCLPRRRWRSRTRCGLVRQPVSFHFKGGSNLL